MNVSEIICYCVYWDRNVCNLHTSINTLVCINRNCLCVCSGLGSDDPSPIIFAHQTKWQQRILHLYGRDMCVIDSTYNTTVYDLPLLALCVLTNVGYVTVASVLLCDERQQSIAAALRVIADWNCDWKPRHFMTDFHEGQIAAVASVFPGKTVEDTCLLNTSLCNSVMYQARLACVVVCVAYVTVFNSLSDGTCIEETTC